MFYRVTKAKLTFLVSSQAQKQIDNFRQLLGDKSTDIRVGIIWYYFVGLLLLFQTPFTYWPIGVRFSSSNVRIWIINIEKEL